MDSFWSAIRPTILSKLWRTAPGAASMEWSDGARIADAIREATPTGIRNGARRCARRWTGCAMNWPRHIRKGCRFAQRSVGGARRIHPRNSQSVGRESCGVFRRACDSSVEDGEQVAALKLLEMQRHAMLMYTSCGWFFDELSGLETVQVIHYAGRVVQLAKEFIGAVRITISGTSATRKEQPAGARRWRSNLREVGKARLGRYRKGRRSLRDQLAI